jgi:cytidylate kinase
MGSLGQEIAQKIGGLLDYRVVGREIINQAAIQTGAPEIALAAIDELGLLGICPSPEACDAYRQQVARLVIASADAGQVVIIGRAGQIILANYPGVFHVQVVAPKSIRISRVAQAQNIPLECAKNQVDASDRFRQRYLRQHYHADWNDSSLYDLVINTSQISIKTAAELVIAALSTQDVPATTDPSGERVRD